jgi:transaldolase
VYQIFNTLQISRSTVECRYVQFIRDYCKVDIFLDTADIKEVEDLIATGQIDGITTNPSLAAKAGMSFEALIKHMCSLTDGPVSAEVSEETASGMIAQGLKLTKIAKNVAIKVPLTIEGLKACKALSEQELMVNVTLCFSATQALLAAKAGATFISPFIGRINDIGGDGVALIRDIRTIYDNYGLGTAILAASIRNVNHVVDVAKAGADVATMPPSVFRQLYKHPLTDLGLKAFQADWDKSGLVI